MAKKREWKAWMVVDKKGRPTFDDPYPIHRVKRGSVRVYTEYQERGDRIIRVRIVEDGR